MAKFKIRDTVLLSGWLFADLLLGLMVIFMVSIPGAPPRVIELIVTPDHLERPQCRQAADRWECTLKLTETAISVEPVHWTASSDIGNEVTFTPQQGMLTPGTSVSITAGSIPCQNGAFIFHTSSASNVTVSQWACPQPSQRLERTFCHLVLDDQDPDKFSTNAQFAYSVLKPQVDRQAFLKGRKAGIVIANGGIDDFPNDVNRGSNIAHNAYTSLQIMGKTEQLFKETSYYGDLFTSTVHANKVVLDIYLVIRPDNNADTCPGTHPPG